METPKVTEKINDDGAAEVTVKTVDYRMPAGRDENPDKEKVEITHVTEEAEQRAAGTVVANAAAEVGKKLQAAKEAVFPPAAADDDDKGDKEEAVIPAAAADDKGDKETK